MARVKVSRRQVSSWLDDVTTWQTLDGLKQLESVTEALNVEDLSQFLYNLEFTLASMMSVSEALEQLPSVGQLLGRICALPALTSHQKVYQPLAKCILWFAVDTPCTHVERRAKSWALALIRCTIQRKNFTSQVALQTGHVLDQFSSLVAEEIEASLVQHLNKPRRRWSSSLQCYVPALANSDDLPQTQQILSVMSYCLHHYHIQAYRNCLDIVVRLLDTSPDSSLIEKAAESLAKHQQQILHGMNKEELSYDTSRFLWCTRLASLEEAVLHMLIPCCAGGDFQQEQFLQLVKQSHLARMLTEEYGLFLVVSQMLASILTPLQNEALVKTLTEKSNFQHEKHFIS